MGKNYYKEVLGLDPQSENAKEVKGSNQQIPIYIYIYKSGMKTIRERAIISHVHFSGMTNW